MKDPTPSQAFACTCSMSWCSTSVWICLVISGSKAPLGAFREGSERVGGSVESPCVEPPDIASGGRSAPQHSAVLELSIRHASLGMPERSSQMTSLKKHHLPGTPPTDMSTTSGPKPFLMCDRCATCFHTKHETSPCRYDLVVLLPTHLPKVMSTQGCGRSFRCSNWTPSSSSSRGMSTRGRTARICWCEGSE